MEMEESKGEIIGQRAGTVTSGGASAGAGAGPPMTQDSAGGLLVGYVGSW